MGITIVLIFSPGFLPSETLSAVLGGADSSGFQVFSMSTNFTAYRCEDWTRSVVLEY
jgi:hypothetical protein